MALPGQKPAEFLIGRWKTYTPKVREAALEGFWREPARLPALLDAIEAGKIQPWSLTSSRRGQLTRFPDESIRSRAASLFAGISSSRQAAVQRYKRATAVRADGRRGQEVFKKQCSQCHKVGQTGVQVGPDLVSFTGRSKEELLANILDPSSNIVAGYEEYLIQTSDGRIITGVMARQSATAVTLRRAEGAEDKVLRRDIAELRALSASAMPEGLEEAISVDEMADLLEYLNTLSGSGQPSGR